MGTGQIDIGKTADAVNAAGSSAFAAWVTLLGIVAFIAITVGGITDVQLLLGQPIDLPLTGVKVPASTFFFLAPIIFILAHANFLLYLQVLDRRLAGVLPSTQSPQETANAADEWIDRLSPSPVTLGLISARARPASAPAFGTTLDAVLTITGVGLPVLILLACQARYVPYHDVGMTWLHRIVLLADLALVAMLWPHTKTAGALRSERARIAAWSGSIALAALPVLLSLFVIVVPDEALDRWAPRILIPWMRAQLFGSDVDPTSGRPTTPFSNFLILANLRLDGNKLSLRGRDLRNAVFVNADLRNASFVGANLEGADFTGATLSGADFSCGQSTIRVGPGDKLKDQDEQDDEARASRRCTNLRFAKLKEATATRAVFREADLRGADFYGTFLSGATFVDARLDGASLEFTSLEFTNFNRATLRAANLRWAYLFNTTFHDATLEGADVVDAWIDHASLMSMISNSKADGLSFRGTSIWCRKSSSDCAPGATADDTADKKTARIIAFAGAARARGWTATQAQQYLAGFDSVVGYAFDLTKDMTSARRDESLSIYRTAADATSILAKNLLEERPLSENFPSHPRTLSSEDTENLLAALACGSIDKLRSTSDPEGPPEDLQITREAIALGVARRIKRGWDDIGVRQHIAAELRSKSCAGTQAWDDQEHSRLFNDVHAADAH